MTTKPSHLPQYDLAITGSGFGGALLAMIARRLGYKVMLLERGRHPRFVIGESSTPLANLLLEELARRYDLPAVASFSKWGTWQRDHRDVGCGLKRGFTFLHHTEHQPWQDDVRHLHQLLVAASPHDRIADTHWYRPDFDACLVREARALGADYLDATELQRVDFSHGLVRLTGVRGGRALELKARFLVDASGPRGFLFHQLNLREEAMPHLPETEALFTHFQGVRRWDEQFPSASSEAPPYPLDDAAVHHVFEGGWIWVLRFNNGLTSAGVAARRDWAVRHRLAEGAPAWERVLQTLPSLEVLFEGAEATHPFVHWPCLSFRCGRITGDSWALLPSAAGFVDPLLSTGFTLNLLGMSRLGQWLERQRPGQRLAEAELLDAYARDTRRELDTAEELISALYAHLGDFELFAALSRLYFAAVSFAETARRLGRPELAGPWFLLAGQENFANGFLACCREARALGGIGASAERVTRRGRLLERIGETIEPVDVAGLGRAEARNWHPVRAVDLLAARSKLGASEEDICGMLDRCGFNAG